MGSLISVIVVTYNRLEYLKLTVGSILQQTYQNFELIIVGDGHQPEVEDYIVSLNNKKISYHYVFHCGYPAKARNYGITHAKGEFIAFCDDDDIWMENKLNRQIYTFDNNKEITLCCTNRAIVSSDGIISQKRSLNWIPKKHNLTNLLLSNYVSYSSVMIRKDILKIAGVFPDELRFRAVEDYHLWLRICKTSKITFLNEVLTLYRIHNSNITTALSIGSARNILVFNDLFSNYSFSYFNRIIAYSSVYLKIIIYKVLGK